MQLIKDNTAQRGKQKRSIRSREQQGKLLWRGEQDVGWIAALALTFGGGRIACSGFDADRQTHLRDRPFEVARDIDRERFQRRNIKRVQTAGARDAATRGFEWLGRTLVAQLHQCR